MQAALPRPLILVSNDDGITAPGIRRLVEIVHALEVLNPVGGLPRQQRQGVRATICTGKTEGPLRDSGVWKGLT